MDIERWRRIEGFVYFGAVVLFVVGASIAIICEGRCPDCSACPACHG